MASGGKGVWGEKGEIDGDGDRGEGLCGEGGRARKGKRRDEDTFEEFAAVDLAGGYFEGDDVALGLVEEFYRDTNCGCHFGGEVKGFCEVLTALEE